MFALLSPLAGNNTITYNPYFIDIIYIYIYNIIINWIVVDININNKKQNVYFPSVSCECKPTSVNKLYMFDKHTYMIINISIWLES